MNDVINGMVALATGLLICLIATLLSWLGEPVEDDVAARENGVLVGGPDGYRVRWVDADRHYQVIAPLGVVVRRVADFDEAIELAEMLAGLRVEDDE